MAPATPISDLSLRRLLAWLANEADFVFLETRKITPAEHRSFVFVKPVARLVCRQGDEPAAFLARAEEELGRGYFLAGWLSYEFGYLLEPALAGARPKAAGSPAPRVLADFGVFPAPFIYDHLTQCFADTGVWPVRDGDSGPGGMEYRIANLRLNMDKSDYLHAFQKIKDYIVAGDTYQVNYTLKFKFDFSGSPLALYIDLRRNQSVSYGACIKAGQQTVLSLSPELFFRKHGDNFTVRPMKGTIKRGRTLAQDEELVDFLKADVKTLSENVMIVDLLRNDLGRLLSAGGEGSVAVQSLFDVETFETLHQMTSTIRGQAGAASNEQISLLQIFKALFPCGSVTGAPKIRTMEIIRELEKEERGVYTGAIGYLAPDGDAVFNVPIRTVVLAGSRGEMGIGSGIVYDSDPHQEWEECELKGRFLTEPAPDFQLLETMLWLPGQGYWLLDLHVERLAESARYFSYPLEPARVRDLLELRARTFCGPRRVRLTISRDGSMAVADAEFMETPAGDRRAVISGKRTDSGSVFLFHKTTRRDLYDEERARATASGYYEVIFENERGEITEGSISNIFIRQGDMYFTPPLHCGLLAGVFRRHFMTVHGNRVRERVLFRRDLEQAEDVYAANSVRGLLRVTLDNE